MNNLTKLAERFCACPLPETVCADLCATDPNYAHPRTGTNLLSVAEAEQVLRYVMAGEFDYRAYCTEADGREAEGTRESLATVARALETYGLAELPANEHGQVDFMRALMESAVAEIRTFLAKGDA